MEWVLWSLPHAQVVLQTAAERPLHSCGPAPVASGGPLDKEGLWEGLLPRNAEALA